MLQPLANRLLYVLGKDCFMLCKILCGFIAAHSPFEVKSNSSKCQEALFLILCLGIITAFLTLYNDGQN